MQLSSYTARTPEDKVTEKRAVQRQYKEAILCQIMGALTIGYADVVYLPRKGSAKPAMVIELKWNKSVECFLQRQIGECCKMN